MSKETMILNILTAVCYFLVNNIEGKPTTTAEDYLVKFGYLASSTGGDVQQAQDASEALRRLQSFAGLKVTGTFDNETVELMKQPRCGDKDPTNYRKRRRRYVLEGSKWKKKDLTYRILNNPYDGPTSREHLPPELISKTIKAAFQKWSFASQLTFMEITEGEADIMIKFIRGNHNDGYNFDGRGGSLAHAFYPHTNELGIAGDAHFDLDEKFSLTELGATNFIWVTTHEFGHSLGLHHSNVKGAIMYPWLQTGVLGDVELQKDDLDGIQRLYGKPTGMKREPKIILPSPPRPECKEGFQAAFHDKHHKRMYGFMGRDYLVLAKHGTIKGPKPYKERWPGLDIEVRAAYTRNDGRTVFFSRFRYYIYDGTRLVEGPRFIKHYGLPTELRTMDAAIVFSRNRDTYFFKGNQYWRFNEKERRIYEGYPKLISQYWRGLPETIDAALQTLDGETIFFKGGQYYKLHHNSMRVLPSYPKPIGPDWLACSEDESENNVLVPTVGGSSLTLRSTPTVTLFITFFVVMYRLL